MSTSERFQIPLPELRSLFKFHNPETGTFTCVGHAPSKRRRCRNPIAQGNQAAANSMLRQLAQSPDDHAQLEIQLQKLAGAALCQRNHQNQSAEIVRKWRQIVVEEVDRHAAPSIPNDIRDLSRSPSVTRSVRPHNALCRHQLQRAEPAVATPRIQRSLTERSDHNAERESATATDGGNECRICFETYEDPCRTPCGHKFCRTCISAWITDHRTCPFDRRPLRVRELIPVEDSTCAICCEGFVEPCRTPCGHIFCRACIETWLINSSRRTCPFDRRPLRVVDLVPVTDS